MIVCRRERRIERGNSRFSKEDIGGSFLRGGGVCCKIGRMGVHPTCRDKNKKGPGVLKRRGRGGKVGVRQGGETGEGGGQKKRGGEGES